MDGNLEEHQRRQRSKETLQHQQRKEHGAQTPQRPCEEEDKGKDACEKQIVGSKTEIVLEFVDGTSFGHRLCSAGQLLYVPVGEDVIAVYEDDVE